MEGREGEGGREGGREREGEGGIYADSSYEEFAINRSRTYALEIAIN